MGIYPDLDSPPPRPAAGMPPASSCMTEYWAEINVLAPVQAYPPGVNLFLQGAPPQEVYLIETGLIKLCRYDEDGGEIIIDLRFPGWLLGTDSVLIQQSYPVTAVTLTRCNLRRIPAGIFEHQLKSNAELSWRLHQMHSRELHSQVNRVTMLGCLTARQRLEQLLWQLSGLEPAAQKEVRLQLPLKGHEIARWIAITPAYLSRLFEQLEAAGLIRRHKGWLVIPDARSLWHNCDSPTPQL
ncbi:MAG TPA: Crp/Fnr family transcriptional regulator [Pyrinomonadaceae bacterium]|nr:Crp/Fnr family transcriptional regulator [Pyrinomonadaceae bacterium]